MAPTQSAARRWVDQYWHESWGAKRAKAEGRERK